MPDLKLYASNTLWLGDRLTMKVVTSLHRAASHADAFSMALSSTIIQKELVATGKKLICHEEIEFPEETLKRLGIKLVDPEG